MFRSHRSAERAALAPLLEMARARHGADRRLWLDDLRREAPVMVARLEALLAEEHAKGVASLAAARAASSLDVAPAVSSVPAEWTTSAA
jgi:hypothetical protein